MKILADANSLCHKAKHTLGELTHETARVGIIFGFLCQIQTLVKEYRTNDICFAWDSQSSLREKLFPDYKIKRRTQKSEKTEEEKEQDKLDYAQFDLLHESVLPTLGVVNNYKFDGFEGDDILAAAVFDNPHDDFVIATGDEDMYQLLCPGVSIRKSKQNGKGKKTYYLYTDELFKQEFGIDPAQWVEVKALAGCTSDEVPGIPNIGEDSAAKYIRGDMAPHLKRFQAIRSAEGKAIRERNIPLVQLPFEGCPEVILKKQGPMSYDGFIKICQTYDFQYFLKKDNLNQWKELLNLK